jgi:cytochrome c553
MKRILALSLIALAPFATSQAEEAAHGTGETLYQAHCTSCHGTDVMTRSDHRVQSMEQLKAQVQRCEQNLKLKWVDDDIEHVVRYLNQAFYKF